MALIIRIGFWAHYTIVINSNMEPSKTIFGGDRKSAFGCTRLEVGVEVVAEVSDIQRVNMWLLWGGENVTLVEPLYSHCGT